VVFDSTRDMRHLPFFAELAALEDSDAAWRAVSAGLVVLRLVDAWIEEGSAVMAADGWGIRSVRAAIEEIPRGRPVRAILTSVVNALGDARGGNMEAIAPRLMAYARSLDLDAKWALAADVYETVVAHVHPIEESDVAIAAHIRLGFTHRALGNIERSAAAYDDASRLAVASGDIVGALRAQIGRARVAITRGNLPEAERTLEDAVERAGSSGLEEVRASALQERAMVAHLREQYDSAIRFAYEALRDTTDPINRDRLLADIAGSFYLLGARSVARDAYLVLEATAQEQYQRWVAAINLMEIAAADGSSPLFERYRRQLLEQPLPPTLQAQLFLHIGEGYLRIGEPELARPALKRASSLAERFGYNQLAFAADAGLRALARPTHSAEQSSTELPADLREIAAEVRERGRDVALR
jgi:hypothetical protein